MVPVRPGEAAARKAAWVLQAGTVRVPFVAPGQEARLRVRAWLATGGAAYDQAKVRAETNIVVMLGGVGQPPSFPATLRNFPSITLCP